MRRKPQHQDPNILRGGVIEVASSSQSNEKAVGSYNNNSEISSNPASSNNSATITMTDADVAAGGTGGASTTTSSNQFYAQYNDYYVNDNHQMSSTGGAMKNTGLIPTPPASLGGRSISTTKSDLEFFDDLVSDPVLIFGVDISHLSKRSQFILCASGVFGFSLFYGILQELLSVQLCNRQLGLFLATAQFTGYTILSFIMRTYVYEREKRRGRARKKKSDIKMSPSSTQSSLSILSGGDGTSGGGGMCSASSLEVPFRLYLGLSLLRAVDLGMTNLAMQYINYPAKTLMKSSRVVFTMIFGVLISKKKYRLIDYFIVICMVFGLAIFMHADANSSAVFQPLGVVMLTVSLVCDGAITNMSETIMNQFGVGQDEFIFRMYSIALVAIAAAAWTKGDLRDGIIWMVQPGTYAEQQSNVPIDERTWSSSGKIGAMVLFSSMGFFGSSCSAAITKNFGALAMSITSTARKATTLFLSFFLFDNECTFEHITGIFIFVSALTAKSLKRGGRRSSMATSSSAAAAASRRRKKARMLRHAASSDLELGSVGTNSSLDGTVTSSSAHDRSRPPLAASSSFGSIESGGSRGLGSRRRVTSTSASPRANRSGHNSPKVRYHVV